nr:integrase, catalytic region, zinc finger, CCHC-type, peptidase aspartic, catalytic [Tanacetum cinerariifolium]
ETFHKQTDDELTDKEVKKMEADDQAIQTILMGLPKDIYAAFASCETAQEILLRDLDKIEEVNANCILMANLQHASTSGTQNGKAPIYDLDGSAEIIQICLWVYFVKGLGHNLFSVGQFCDSDLEAAFKRNTYFVRNLGVDLLKGNHTTNLYTVNLHEMAFVSPICLMARATSTKSWLWHQRLSHLNFKTINDLAKNDLVIGLPKLKYHKEYLCPLYAQRTALVNQNLLTPDASITVEESTLTPTNSSSQVYNQRTKKIMEMMSMTFNKLSAMAFEQRSLKPRLQSMTSGEISSRLDLTYAPSTITSQKPTERELELLFEAIYDDYMGG